MTPPARVGMLGCGFIWEFHAPDMRDASSAPLVASGADKELAPRPPHGSAAERSTIVAVPTACTRVTAGS